MSHTHDLGEWAAVLSASCAAYAALSAPVVLLAPADTHVSRDAAITAAALLALLIPASPERATR